MHLIQSVYIYVDIYNATTKQREIQCVNLCKTTDT